MSYEQLKTKYIKGWHTWNVYSVLSHVHMPNGLALNIAFKEYATGGYLKETLIGRFSAPYMQTSIETAFPGIHTYDGIYTRMDISWCEMDIRIESTVDGEDLFLLVTPVTFQKRPAMAVLEAGYLWGRPGIIQKVAARLSASDSSGTTVIQTTGTFVNDPNLPVQNAFLSVSLNKPICFYTGKQRDSEEIAKKIAEGEKIARQRHAKYGDLAYLYEAVESTLAWDTIYDPKYNRVITPVSRLWSIGNGGYVLFCWDNFFAGFMAALGCKELAYSNLIEILNERTADGFVPNFAYATGQKSADRSQPPVGSAMLLEVYRIYQEDWIVKEMYPALLGWNKWFEKNRMDTSGALCWGSNPIEILYGNRWESDGVHDTFGAALESGLDNSPMYDEIPFDKEKNRLKLLDVGLTGLYILDCHSLIELAKIIGCSEDIPALRERLNHAEKGLESLWDEKDGFYYNRRTDTGEFSKRISPTNFYALFSSRIPDNRLERIASEHYFNREKFYGDWMLPSIARNDPAFTDQEYWRGRVWAPLNFLVYLALCQRNSEKMRSDLAQKSVDIFLPEWNEKRHVHENYNSITGEGCDSRNSDKFYHWGALLPTIALIHAGYVKGFGEGIDNENNKHK